MENTPANQGGDDTVDSDAGNNGQSPVVTLTSGETDDTVDAGYYTPASLGDYVWLDDDGDGIQDGNESGIEGAEVTLLADLDGDGQIDDVVGTTTTDPTGFYEFTGLAPDDYIVVFTTPTGLTPTDANQGGDDTVDSDADVNTGESHVVNLESGEHDPTIDAGFYEAASIGDFVWSDTDGDGVQDANEPGIEGATVTLLADLDGDGQIDDVVATTTTDPTGFYEFTGLQPDDYIVEFTTPTGFEPTDADQGGDDTKDSDADVNSGQSPVVTLTSGENNPTIDAGFFELASLGDYVWLDDNADGIQDPTESGIEGVTVTLLADTDGDGQIDDIVATTTTDPTGFYEFVGLQPDDYIVEFTAPTGFEPTDANQGGDDTVDSDADQGTGQSPVVTLSSGENNPTIDAGYYEPATIGDYVWEDTDGDGIQDPTESGIDGVTVTLLADLDGDGQIDDVVATTTTDPTGFYEFTGLQPDDYIVVFTTPTDFEPTNPNQGGDDSVDSDINPSGQTGVINLESGENDDTIDAGYFSGASLGDYVWLDTDADGIQDGNESGIEGVTVTLLADLDGDGQIDDVVATTTTDPTGFYQFVDLVPGDYVVEFTTPNGFEPSDPNQGGDDTVDSDAVNGQSQIVTLTSGEDNPTIDAGFFETATIGDFVWADSNGDGVQDAGEPGIEGAVVTLLADLDNDGQIDDILATTTTDENGFYEFTDLVPGDYIVQFTTPDNFVPVDANQGGNDATDSDADPNTGLSHVITLESGDNDDTVDAGFSQFDLALTIVLDDSTPGPFAPGDQVTFKITVTNQGSLDADNVEVTNYIPDGLQLSDPAWNGGAGAATYIVDQTIPAGGGMAMFTITFMVENDFQGIELVDYAEISGYDNGLGLTDFDSPTDNDNTNDAGGEPESPADNYIDGDGTGAVGDGVAATDEDDHDPVRIEIIQTFDLALRKTLNIDETTLPLYPGDDVVFDIEIFNQGTIPATNIEVTEYVPDGLVLVDNSWQLFNGLYRTHINGPLAPGDSMTIQVRMRVANDFAGGSISNAVEIKGADNPLNLDDIDSTPDTNSGNDPVVNDEIDDQGDVDEDDHDIEVIEVEELVDVELDKSVSQQFVNVGDVVTFTIEVSNNGPAVATGVVVEDYIPTGYSNITNVSNGGIVTDGNITWSGLTIASGASVTLTFDATVEDSDDYVNEAEVTGADQLDIDSTPDNGVDTDNDGNCDNDNGDEDDGDCAEVDVNCTLTLSYTDPVCDNNGTPDPSDDFYTFEFVVNAVGVHGCDHWTTSSPYLNGGEGLYGVTYTAIIPTSVDIDNEFIYDGCQGSCRENINIESPVDPAIGCYDECLITDITVENIICNNNNTGGNPNDDGYFFDFTVEGFNIPTWSATINGEPVIDLGVNGRFETVGPYAPGTTIVIEVQNVDDPTCTDSYTFVLPTETCSNDECYIGLELLDGPTCDNNGTPSDPSDDTFTFTLGITGNNGGTGWTDSQGNSGSFPGVQSYTMPIGDGSIVVVSVTDDSDSACSNMIMVTPPPTCSNDCDITATLISGPTCSDAGTDTVNEDDTYSFTVTVTGDNFGSGWTAYAPDNTPIATGVYDNPTLISGLLIGNGDPVGITFRDNDSDNCSDVLNITPPEPCSDACTLSVVQIGNAACDDNDTDDNPDDDVFYFDLEILYSNDGAWQAFDGENVIPITYSGVHHFGPYSQPFEAITVTVSSLDDSTCPSQQIVVAPPTTTCSNTCSMWIEVLDVICDPGETPYDASDDQYIAIVRVDGYNTSGSWTPDGINSYAIGSVQTFDMGLITAGAQVLSVWDIADNSCGASTTIAPPDACDICHIGEVEIGEPECDDNNTPDISIDDTFTVNVTINGLNDYSDLGWKQIGGTAAGQYGVPYNFGPFPILDADNDGVWDPIHIVIADATDNSCRVEFDLLPPDPCSNGSAGCNIFADFGNITCDSNGTSTPDDDTFGFDMTVVGQNTGNCWTAYIGNDVVATGDFTTNTTAHIDGVAIGNGAPVAVAIIDCDDSDCTYAFIVNPPAPCSDCTINAVASDVHCELPLNGTFQFNLVVNVAGDCNGTGWYIPGTNYGGQYGQSVTISAQQANGQLTTYTIVDASDASVSTVVTVQAPAADECSSVEPCVITAEVINLHCTEPLDGTYQYEVIAYASGDCGDTWTIDGTGLTANYGETISFTGQIPDGLVHILNITDTTNPNSTTTAKVHSPEEGACTPTPCILTAYATDVQCSESLNGTYQFNLTVTSNGACGTRWELPGTAYSGNYGQTILITGQIADGLLHTFTVADVDDSGSTTTIDVQAPTAEECTPEPCELTATVSDVHCTQPLDGTYEFSLSVSSSGDCGSGWTLSGTTFGGNYGQTIVVTGQVADGQTHTFIIVDDFTNNSTTVEVQAPDENECVEACTIVAEVIEVGCSPALDGTFEFDVLVTANTAACGTDWIIEGTALGGSYGNAVTFSGLPANGEEYNFTIVSTNDPSVTTTISVVAPTQEECTPCSLTPDVIDVFCDDNGTPQDVSDDTYSFTFRVTGGNDGSCWSSNLDGFSGDYGVIYTFGPYPSSQNISFSIWDCADTNCATAVYVQAINCYTAPDCEISVTQTDAQCDDNGTPDDDNDDFYYVTLSIRGNDGTSGCWTANTGESGSYPAIVDFGPFTEDQVDIVITDCGDSGCSTTITVYPPALEVVCPISNHYCPILDEDIMLFTTDPNQCTATVEVPMPDVAENCSPSYTVFTEVWANNGTQLIATMNDGDNRTLTDLEIGDYIIRYFVMDAFGVQTQLDCIFRVADVEEPGLICIGDVAVALGGSGTTNMFADVALLSSYDNCGIADVQIRRIFTRDPITCDTIEANYWSEWSDYVTFGCCDAGLNILVELRVTDNSGNYNSCWINVDVRDETLPQCYGLADVNTSCNDLPDSFNPYDIGSLSVAFGVPDVIDNCSAETIELAPIVELGDCLDGTITRRFMAVDAVGNISSEIFEQVITIVDQCCSPEMELEGLITTAVFKPIKDVEVTLTQLPIDTYVDMDVTEIDGIYNFANVIGWQQYEIRPEKDINPTNGVSTQDLIAIQRHILGIQLLDTPYQLIAADVNNSGSITTLDLIELQNLIIGNITEFSNNTSWVFIPKSYEFPDPANPWAYSVPQTITVGDFSGSIYHLDFIGVKIGDVNLSASPSSLDANGLENRSQGMFELKAPNINLQSGEEYEVSISSSQIEQIGGLQFTLDFNQSYIEVLDIDYGLIQPTNINTKSLGRGLIGMNWTRYAGANDSDDNQFLKLRIRAIDGGVSLQDVLALSSSVLTAEAYDRNDNNQVLGIDLSFYDVEANAVEMVDFAVSQNMPNPFRTTTKIDVNLPYADQAEFVIHDLSGKAVYQKTYNFDKGHNVIDFENQNIAAGVYYYSVSTTEFSKVMKMIIVR